MSKEEREKGIHGVVFRSPYAVTWGVHKSKADFEKWYEGKMKDGTNMNLRDVYEIVAEGVATDEIAITMSGASRREVDQMVKTTREQRIAAGLPVGELTQRAAFY